MLAGARQNTAPSLSTPRVVVPTVRCRRPLLSLFFFFFVQVWDLKRNNSRVTMRGHRGSVTCVSFFDRDSCVAAGDERGKVVLHRVADAPSDDEVGWLVGSMVGFQ